MMTRRKASEISKAELVSMVARLRGVLYGILEEPAAIKDDFYLPELEEVLEETTFDDDICRLRDCEKCGASGPCLWDTDKGQYVCRACHVNPEDVFWGQ